MSVTDLGCLKTQPGSIASYQASACHFRSYPMSRHFVASQYRSFRVLAVRKRNPIWSSCRAEDRFLCFFALRMTTGPKIPGTVIPRRVFTQPGSRATELRYPRDVCFSPDSDRIAARRPTTQGAITEVTGLIVIFVPGYAREIAASVMPFSKIQLGIDGGGLVIGLPDAACPHDPWPYGCEWLTPIGRKQIVKKVRTRHHPYVLITVR